MHKLILSSTFLSAADAEKPGSDVFHDLEPLTLKTIEKYQQSIYLQRWQDDKLILFQLQRTGVEIKLRLTLTLTLTRSGVEVNNRLYTLW